MALKLTKAVKKEMLDDKHLFFAVSEKLDIKINSLYSLINKDSQTLARYDVAKLIAKHLKISIDELFEQETELVS